MDAVLARLYEQLATVSSPDVACSLVLECVVSEAAFERAILQIREPELRVAGWSVPDTQLAAVRDLLQRAQADSASVSALITPDLLSSHESREYGFDSAVTIPFTGSAGHVAGALVADTPGLDGRVQHASELLQRLGPVLTSTLRAAALTGRARRLEDQRDLLGAINNSLTDPVVLTNADSEILLSNQRAEHLFTCSDLASEGRRRAVHINNSHFGSFLRQTILGGELATRELTLVDPDEGTDLLVEVFSTSINYGPGPQSGYLSILRDITDLKRVVNQLEVEYRRSRSAEHHARQERDRLNVVLENVSDPVLLTDEHSNIILMNPEADRIFVAPVDSDPQTAWSRLVQANDTQFTSLISNFLVQPERRRVEHLDLVDPDTTRPFPAQVTSTKISNLHGEPTAIVSVLHDLTQFAENQRLAHELQSLNEQLEQRIFEATNALAERNRQLELQRSELEKASRSKSEFVAAMSHELRTPLNVIIGYCSLLRERIYGELTDVQDDTLARVHGTSQHLLELINSVLDLSKIEAGKMPLQHETVEIPGLIAELSETVAPMIRRKQLDFDAIISPDLPTLTTDRTKLKQVLLNLLSNAIKFTVEGRITLIAERVGTKGVRFTVADTGIGIKPEHLNDIFEDFRQLDQSHTREHGGTGLGLTISKNLLALLGGTISVESTYGLGSRFVVDLPYGVPTDALPDSALRSSGPAPVVS